MLTAKIMRQFHIKQDWSQAGYYETARAKEIGSDIRAAIMAGRLVALSGPVGVGKTVMVKQLQSLSEKLWRCLGCVLISLQAYRTFMERVNGGDDGPGRVQALVCRCYTNPAIF